MKYLHAMLRVHDLDAALRFFRDGLGLHETRRIQNEGGRFTLVFLAAEASPEAEIELTWNWPDADGKVEVYRDGHMAFVKSPDGISIELLQAGEPLAPVEPWISMPNAGSW